MDVVLAWKVAGRGEEAADEDVKVLWRHSAALVAVSPAWQPAEAI